MAVSKESWRGKDRVKRFITDNGSGNMIYTPVKVVDSMLDLLPEEIWGNKDAKFLDICSKSGVFLERIYWRLENGLREQIPNFMDRSDHILTKQLFGLAPSEDYAEKSRGTVYGAYRADHQRAFTDKFGNRYGNIKAMERVIDGYKNDIFEIIKEQTGEMFKDTIKEAFGDMKFDVIIGNPPYQENNGGGNHGAIAIYPKFIDKAFKLNAKYISMIVPTRWYSGDGNDNTGVRKLLLSSHTKYIVDYTNSQECFEAVNINGGVGYFLYDKDYKGKCTVRQISKGIIDESEATLNSDSIFIRFKHGRNIVSKLTEKGDNTLSKLVYPKDPFGIETSARGEKEKSEINNTALKSSMGVGFISSQSVNKNKDIISKYKVITGGMVNTSDKVINIPEVLEPGTVCTATYSVIGAFDRLETAYNYISYIKTKFVRALIAITVTNQRLSVKNYQLVPVQDFSKPWTDVELYNKYNLTQEEIDFIESMIKPME